MVSVEYLERARTLTERKTDYALAKLLGITDGAVNHYRTGRRIMDDATCLKLADALKIDVGEVIAARNIDRAKTPENAQRWREELKRYASAVRSALCFALALAVTIGAAGESRALTGLLDCGTTQSAAQENEPVYKLCAYDPLRIMARIIAYVLAVGRSLRSRTHRENPYAIA